MARGSDGSALEPETTLRPGLMSLDGNWRWLVFRGVLALAVALLAFVLPGNATIVFTFIFAVYCGVDGIASMVAGIRGATNRIHHWGALVMRGMLGVAVAALFILMPLVVTVNYALLTLSTLILWALLSGIL